MSLGLPSLKSMRELDSCRCDRPDFGLLRRTALLGRRGPRIAFPWRPRTKVECGSRGYGQFVRDQLWLSGFLRADAKKVKVLYSKYCTQAAG